MPRPRPAASADRGSATVETALALPSLLLLTLALAGILAGLAAQIRCVDAARLAARGTARGEDPAAVRNAVAAELPHARLDIGSADGFVKVAVSTPVLGLPLLRGFTVRAEAEEVMEDADPTADG